MQEEMKQEETRGFLETVFAPYDGEGWVEIRCLTAALGTVERSVPRRWFPLTKNGLCDAGQWAVRQAQDWNVYYGVLPRAEAGQGGADATFATGWLWCDIDNAPTWNHVAALLNQAELPPPRLAVTSGNGCHAYWQMAARACLPTPETKTAFRGLLKRLCAKIGGEPDGPHADPASTDAARILRLPGTFNWKDAANPKPVKIVHWNPEAYGLSAEQWVTRLPAENLPPPAWKTAGKKPPYTNVHPLLRDVSPTGCRHQNAVRVLMCLRQWGAGDCELEAAARDFCALNAFPADEMDNILEWVHGGKRW